VGENRGNEQDDEHALGGADGFGYRRPIGAFSTNLPRLSASALDAQGFSDAAALTGGMDKPLADRDTRRLPDLGMAVKSIIGFWLLYMALVTLRAVVLQYPEFTQMLLRRCAATGVGAVVTFFVYLAMRAARNMSLTRKATLAGILCLPAALLFSSANYAIF
jgi:hypothetical protein